MIILNYEIIFPLECSFSNNFVKVKKWLGELQLHGPADIIIAIAGNKSDLSSTSEITKEMGEDLAKENNAFHIWTSAKSGEGVAELYETLAKSKYWKKFICFIRFVFLF